jgi:hypothetical protein
MPLHLIDQALILRAGASNLTATEAAGTNVILVPPGYYWVDISVPAAPTGTTPTLVTTFDEAADGSTWAAINPQVTFTASGSKQEMTHLVRVTKQATSGVTANFTAINTTTGTTPNWGKVVQTVSPFANAPSLWRGLP